jgi:hypothetical protein
VDREQKPLLVTQGEALTLLGGIGRTKLWDLVNNGEIVGVNVGRRSFITVKSVAAYVDRLTQAAEADYDLDATMARHKGRAAI